MKRVESKLKITRNEISNSNIGYKNNFHLNQTQKLFKSRRTRTRFETSEPAFGVIKLIKIWEIYLKYENIILWYY